MKGREYGVIGTKPGAPLGASGDSNAQESLSGGREERVSRFGGEIRKEKEADRKKRRPVGSSWMPATNASLRHLIEMQVNRAVCEVS